MATLRIIANKVKILNEGLGIRQVMVQVARAETQVAQGRYKNLTPETKAKRVLLDISKEILASSSQEIMTKDQIVDLEEKLAEASKAIEQLLVSDKLASSYPCFDIFHS